MDALALPSASRRFETTPEPMSAQQLADAGWREGHAFSTPPRNATHDRSLGRFADAADEWPGLERSASTIDAPDLSPMRCLRDDNRSR